MLCCILSRRVCNVFVECFCCAVYCHEEFVIHVFVEFCCAVYCHEEFVIHVFVEFCCAVYCHGEFVIHVFVEFFVFIVTESL